MANESCTAKPKAAALPRENGGSLAGDSKVQLVSREILRLVRRLAARPSGGARQSGASLRAFTRKSCRASMKCWTRILLPIGEATDSGANFQRQDRRTDCPNLQGRPREDEAGGQQRAAVVQALQKEMARLTDASKEGQLSDRGKPEQFQGAYAEIVRGVNNHAGRDPAAHRRSNRIWLRSPNGKIDELIAQTYKGDHEKMKLAVNNVAVVVQGCRTGARPLNDASQRWTTFRPWQAGNKFQGAYAGNRWLAAGTPCWTSPAGPSAGNRILAQISNARSDD